MPRIAAEPFLTANNSPLPDSWEFFCLPETGEIDGIGFALSKIPPQHKF